LARTYLRSLEDGYKSLFELLMYIFRFPFSDSSADFVRFRSAHTAKDCYLLLLLIGGRKASTVGKYSSDI